MTKFLLALAVPVLAGASILPDAIGTHPRTGASPVNLTDRPVWDEYGLKESEAAIYQSGKDKFTVTAWRLNDTTGAMASFDWQRPAKATPSKLAPMAVETKDSALLVHGNYLLLFTGRKPQPEEVAELTASLKNVDGTALPVLPGYLPSQNLVPNSERYIMGPEALSRFYPGIPASVAAFSYAAEGVMGSFGSGKVETAPPPVKAVVKAERGRKAGRGRRVAKKAPPAPQETQAPPETRVAIFNYPTHQIAMQREPEFRKLQGAIVKRSGPLVAVVLNAPDPDLAERLLGQVRYQAMVTRDEYVPTMRDNIGNLVVNAFVLIGILVAFAVVAGLAVGGLRLVRGRGSKGEEAEAILSLHIDRR